MINHQITLFMCVFFFQMNENCDLNFSNYTLMTITSGVLKGFALPAIGSSQDLFTPSHVDFFPIFYIVTCLYAYIQRHILSNFSL